MDKIIKFRLFTWFEEVDSPVMPGQTVLAERIAHLGEKIDITNPAYVTRGEELGAFYTDEEAAAIEDGTYRGFDSDAVFRARAGINPVSPIEPVEGEGINVDSLSDEEIAEYIRENNLNVDETVALAGNTVESIEKILDAEKIYTDNDPRVGVEKGLDKKLAAVTAGN